VLDEVEASRFRAVSESALALDATLMRCRVGEQASREEFSELQIFEEIFGVWLEKYVLLPVRVRLESSRPLHASTQQRHWNQCNLMELMTFFLDRFLESALLHPEKQRPSYILEAARANLIGKVRRKVLSSALDFNDAVLNDITTGIPFCLKRFLTLGRGLVVDEAIWAYFSRAEKRRGKLAHMKNKPPP
jgi:hypothetical protein